MPSKKRPRLPRFDYVGKYRYFLTFCCHERRRVFEDDLCVALVSEQILRTSSEHQFKILAHVYMPDHLHLVVEGTGVTSDLRQFASRAKQMSGYTFGQWRRERLWQPSYFDHWIRPEESELPFVRYVLENPLRAGLVRRCEDYPYLGAGKHSVTEMTKILDEAGIDVWKPVRETAKQP